MFITTYVALRKFEMKELQEYIKIVQGAVSDFLKEEPSLLEHGVHEQSISHRIAYHLEQRINNHTLHVDCEYNKNLNEQKRIEVSDLDPTLMKACGCHVCSNKIGDIEREREFRPDIIVHKRRCNDYNKVAIEIKKSKFCPFDEAKLKELTGNGHEYRYILGVFIHFLGGLPKFKWYSKGRNIVI